MTGIVASALSLALALLAIPPSPHQRRPRRGRIISRRLRNFGIIGSTLALGVLLPVPVALAVAVSVAMIESRRRRRHRIRQRRVDGRNLASALEILVGELRVGAHPAHALAVSAAESDGAVSATLGVVGARAQLGGDVADGLDAAADSSAVPTYWTRLAVYWQLAVEHGLAISTLISAAQRDIVERERFTARVDAALAGARATATVLAGLPVLGVLLGQLLGARPLDFLFGGGAGGWLLLVGVVLVCAGIAWSGRIIDRAGR